jgi:hypothetical protein
VALFLAGLFVTVSMAQRLRKESEPSDIVIVKGGQGKSGKAVAERVRSLGAEVLEVYDSFILISAGPTARTNLAREGLTIEEIADRTSAGRGAFRFDSRYGEPTIPDALRADPLKDPDYNVYIVQFIGPVKPDWLEALMATGAEVFAYLPSNSYVTALDRNEVPRVDALRFVQWVGLYHPAYKLDLALLETTETSLIISFALLPGKDSRRAEDIVGASGGSVMTRWKIGDQPWLRVSIGSSSILELARLPEVFSIERSLPVQMANDQATWVVQANLPGIPTIHNPPRNLHGEGQLVTVTDLTPNLAHPMFFDPNNPVPGLTHRKVKSCEPVDGCTTVGCDYLPSSHIVHGTQVASVVAGDAAPYGEYNDHDGHAFASRLIIQDLGDNGTCAPADVITHLFQPSFNMDSRIHTNSWYTNNGGYCAGAVGSDKFMWDNPDYLIVFAAGNFGPGSGVKCEGNAKNVITVGASRNGVQANDTYPDNSRGSTLADGRRKPTLLAPGMDVCTAWPDPTDPDRIPCATSPNSPDYGQTSGTSFAAPAVAGSAALARQYFMEGWYPFGVKGGSQSMVPSAALLKATLVNSAVEMTGAGAYSGSSVKKVPYPAYPDNIGNALRVTKEVTSIDAATATSGTITLNYNQAYKLDLQFYLPFSLRNQVTIADDGRIKAQVVGSEFQILGAGGGSLQQLMSNNAWHHLEVFFHSPGINQFKTSLDGQNLGTLSLPTSHLDKVSVGAAASSGSYGELIIDEIFYCQPVTAVTDPVWSDSFDSFPFGWDITPPVSVEVDYPDNQQGWGRIKLDDALYFSGEDRKLLVCDDRAGLITGQQRVTKVQVTDPNQPLEVTLVWSDRPGTDPQYALVNNLDLVVTSPNGSIYRGNCFQGHNFGQSALNCPAADSVNVEENVLRLAPTESGTWTVTVIGQNVPPPAPPEIYKPQPFALAITGGVVSPPTVTAAADHQTGPGVITQGSYVSTFNSDNVREVFQETLSGGTYKLTHLWRFGNLPCHVSNFALNLEGYRSQGSGRDNFQFSWAPEVNGAPGTFQDITGAIIDKGIEPLPGFDYPFVAQGASDTIYIRARDTGTGSNQTSLFIDRLVLVPLESLADADADEDTSIGPGAPVLGDYLDTRTANETAPGADVYQSLVETTQAGKSHLIKTWTFNDVPEGTHRLHFEGHKSGPGGETFRFWYSTNPTTGFVSIGASDINTTSDPTGGLNSEPFGAGLSGTIYIQIRDTLDNSPSVPDSLFIDQLLITTTS